LSEADVRVWGWCLMSNHVHLVLLPDREDSLSLLMRRVHGRYAQYYNTRWGRTGHLWQNRFFSCILGIEHLWAALAYVERNPIRAGIVHSAAEYQWSSAAAHLTCVDNITETLAIEIGKKIGRTWVRGRPKKKDPGMGSGRQHE